MSLISIRYNSTNEKKRSKTKIKDSILYFIHDHSCTQVLILPGEKKHDTKIESSWVFVKKQNAQNYL